MDLRPLARRVPLATDRATRLLYATDASIYHCEPAGVVFPRNEDDVATAVAFCAERGISLLPRGAGTSLSGQAITSGLVMDLSRFRSIRVEGKTARVECGAVIDAIDRAAAPHGLCWGPAPASSNRATIGGLLVNNGTGARSVVHGMASDHLLSARVMLSDGTVRTFRSGDLDERDPLTVSVLRAADPVLDSPRWPRTWRNASGLDLRGVRKHNSLLPLFCGSEGSLGILLDAEISLVPKPRATRIALFEYDDLVEAMKAVPALLEPGPLAVELMDRRLIELARKTHFAPRFLASTPEALLVVEYDGDERTADYRALGARAILVDPVAQAEVWRTRKEGLGILMSARTRRRPLPFIEDGAVPVERLSEYVTGMKRILARHDLDGAFYAHASAGCLHTRPMLDLADEADRRRMDAIMEEVVDLVASLHGTLTGEHGDGRSKSPYLERIFGPEIVAAFRQVRDSFDPAGIFRPSGDATLRAVRPARAFSPLLEWPQGFADEVDRCNGEAACRKADGVMCPSFQSTGDEALSTRGRANLLRAWLAGEPVEKELDATLAQCLACRACASECPSQVDMARFKAEYKHARGSSPRDVFFANYDALSRIGRVAGVPFPGLVKNIFGLHPAAAITPPARSGFLAEAKTECGPGDCDVILFVDTHIEYYEPSIGFALLALGRALGLRILPWRTGCCGRPAFSRGRLAQARREVERLSFPGSAPVVVVEPSCLSMIRDDAPLLVPSARAIADRVVSVEAFLLERAESIRAKAPAARVRVLYHSHCHQKASGTADEGRRLLELAAEVDVIDCGCCGMAGSFGYERENHQLALAIAERDFLPALRRAAGRPIAVAGRSCREMAARAGVAARHPVEILAGIIGIEREKVS